MIKLNILNMDRFLQAVNECNGTVNRMYPNGNKEDINNNNEIQNGLLMQHKKNKNFLPLYLDIPNGKDYLKIVYYYIGDC